jgi:hypothetical protein
VTPRDCAIGESNPIGRNSVLTSANVPQASEKTASQRRKAEVSGRVSSDEHSVIIYYPYT